LHCRAWCVEITSEETRAIEIRTFGVFFQSTSFSAEVVWTYDWKIYLTKLRSEIDINCTFCNNCDAPSGLTHTYDGIRRLERARPIVQPICCCHCHHSKPCTYASITNSLHEYRHRRMTYGCVISYMKEHGTDPVGRLHKRYSYRSGTRLTGLYVLWAQNIIHVNQSV